MLERYELKAAPSLMVFNFTSTGPKGPIYKAIQFEYTGYPDIYNLAFGDICHTTGRINDLVTTNNGDSEKVLATVVYAVDNFLDQNPKAVVYATGSTKSRTRLYRMGLTKIYPEIKKRNLILSGRRGLTWEPFSNDVDYDAFLIEKA